jgi:Phage integrase, N-terminal SAM-like domain
VAVRESTAESYELNFRLHILPELGDLPLNEITRDRVKQFVANLIQKEHSRIARVKATNAQGKTVTEEKTITRPYSKTTIHQDDRRYLWPLDSWREPATGQPAARPPQCYTDTSPSSRRLKNPHPIAQNNKRPL